MFYTTCSGTSQRRGYCTNCLVPHIWNGKLPHAPPHSLLYKKRAMSIILYVRSQRKNQARLRQILTVAVYASSSLFSFLNESSHSFALSLSLIIFVCSCIYFRIVAPLIPAALVYYTSAPKCQTASEPPCTLPQNWHMHIICLSMISRPLLSLSCLTIFPNFFLGKTNSIGQLHKTTARRENFFARRFFAISISSFLFSLYTRQRPE